MIVKAVGYKNLKGRTGEVELGRATMIVGRNFTGKTAVSDAIKLALLGYHPGLDKTAKAIFALASGDELSALVTTDTGVTVGRVWRRDGSISRKDFVPMNWPETPVVLLDANAYFGASDRGKAELLFGAINAGEWGEQLRRISQRLADLGFPKPQTDLEIQAFVTQALADVETARSEAAASARRYLDTMQGLAALSARSAVPLDADVVEKLKRKRLELSAAEGKVADAKRLAALHEKTATPARARLDELENESLELARLIRAKEDEVGKSQRFFADLLKSQDCPMCGSTGAAWRRAAEEKRDAGEKLLAAELRAMRDDKGAADRAAAEGKPKAEAERKRLKARDAAKLEECEEVVAGLVEEVAALERSLEAYAQDQADRKRLEEARASHDEQAATAKRAEEAKKYLLGVKASLSEQLFKPIVKAAHAFTAGITLGPIMFEDGALGMGRLLVSGGGRVFVHHSAFSGTEQAIVFAALQAALAATAPIKLVVMDELGRIDEGNKAQLLRNVLAALDGGVIDQFVGIDTEAPEVEGFTVVERK